VLLLKGIGQRTVYKETKAVYCKNDKENTNILREGKAEIFCVKHGGIYSVLTTRLWRLRAVKYASLIWPRGALNRNNRSAVLD
jgi:hypothetical protein